MLGFVLITQRSRVQIPPPQPSSHRKRSIQEVPETQGLARALEAFYGPVCGPGSLHSLAFGRRFYHISTTELPEHLPEDRSGLVHFGVLDVRVDVARRGDVRVAELLLGQL